MYVASVKRAPDDLMGRLSLKYGLGTGDVPIFPQMHEAAALVTGATVDAARAVWEGTHQHAVNISGGLHHAMRDRASGFCVYDDPAVAIAWLLAQGATGWRYVDVDVHHGDGVEAAFYGDPRVLTLSVHESGRTCSRAPAGPTRSAPATGSAPTSTSPCRWAPATPAGCGPSTPSCRRCCGPSRRR
jgi:acetoin utilization protein AcuC